ncbi:alkylation response protein AidB-like acyl-CoA dehydrogenase [Actinocorallia herbida]|uniref:Alkylation response protein AidB-like acyl-CoA dehydrogenase n=1 Tax=Actinocorallia herbida TaxID=58109 RepID=A0A3N1CX62_9ACTN|nr:acyl-CoA dehydrogenase family protein [Actinocorallia herbida]ROO85877.1 alkylation response protein AidB-like acyl-CoA dehydrogenase [Actinocorallia herbida]
MTIVDASADTTYLRPATATDDELATLFQPVFDRVAAGNVAREKERILPYEQVDWLKEAGFGRVRIPVEFGGFGASLEQTFALLAALAEADPNVSHIWRNHLAFVEDRLNAVPSETNDRWIRRFLDGEFVGGGWTEANNGTFADLKTTVRADGDRWLVSGAKFYATGSLYADWLDVLGKGDGDTVLTALVRRTDPGVRLVDDWTGFGQRATASGTAEYTDVPAEHGDVFPAGERFAYQGHFYQTAMLSVLVGIARAAQRDGIAALRARGRNYPQALDPVPAADAQLLQVVGQVSVHVFAAEAALSRSSRTLDHVAAAHAAGDADARKDRVLRAEVATAQAQLAIIEAALQVTTTVFDALGASGVSERLLLDRHWRNARTLASHNPRVYKARILGDWLVNATDPVPDLAAFGRGGQGD